VSQIALDAPALRGFGAIAPAERTDGEVDRFNTFPTHPLLAREGRDVQRRRWL
jgi:hypothetical protein